MISPVSPSVMHSTSLSVINKLYISIVYCALVPFLKCAVIVFAGLGLKAVVIKKLLFIVFCPFVFCFWCLNYIAVLVNCQGGY